MKEICIVFPHQLFADSPLPTHNLTVYLVEEYLFFHQYAFHRQKLAFHRASMMRYADKLRKAHCRVDYIDALDERCDVRKLIKFLHSQQIGHIHIIDPVDDWLQKRVNHAGQKYGIQIHTYDNPSFLNNAEDLAGYFDPAKDRYFQTSFYIAQRKERQILMQPNGQPTGGQWSFDADNRKKYPKDKIPPKINRPVADQYWQEACDYVLKNFPSNPGELSAMPFYPSDHHHAEIWLKEFICHRFSEFGHYEDAIVSSAAILHHSVLTPMLNTGLLTPQNVLDEILERSKAHSIPLNSVEGFVRQIIGWLEFIRGVYCTKGVEERTKNFWGFTRKIPPSFYNGTTGIKPVDQTICKVIQSGYVHHIERLMILGNFMLLCEFDPDEVYRWFMELFIDAYDWVMVPNVYGMSQFADGGMLATKPYISGSNYILKMSDYEKGSWQAVWDGLFWRFIHFHRDFFEKNPRLGMLVKSWDRMDAGKQSIHIDNAERFLGSLN